MSSTNELPENYTIETEKSKKLVFEEGWTEIKDDAYAGGDFDTVVFPKSLTAIGEGSFAESNVQTLVIPGNVDTIGTEAFSKCKDLAELRIEKGVKAIDDAAFYECESLEEVILPNSVAELGRYAFAWCSNLKRVQLPEGIEEIPAGCFEHCQSLEEIAIPSSVKKIGENAFKYCGLVSVTFPDHLTVIEKEAFYGTDIREIRLPGTVRIVGDNAFGNCKRLRAVKSSSDTKFYNSFESSSNLKNKPDDSYDKSGRDTVCLILVAMTIIASIFAGVAGCMYSNEVGCGLAFFAFLLAVAIGVTVISVKEGVRGISEEESQYKRIVDSDYNKIEHWILSCISSLGISSLSLTYLGTEKAQSIANVLNPKIVWANKFIDEFLIPTFHLAVSRIEIQIVALVVIELMELIIVEYAITMVRRRAINKICLLCIGKTDI